jgi:hypothetical protein
MMLVSQCMVERVLQWPHIAYHSTGFAGQQQLAILLVMMFESINTGYIKTD